MSHGIEMMDFELFLWLPAMGGFFLAMAFGWVVVKSRFCVVGALTDQIFLEQSDRLYFWLLAMLSALFFTSFLVWQGVAEVSFTHYLMDPVSIARYGVGGSLFGIGMVLSSGCLVKNITRIGSGNLKSFIVIIFAALAGEMVLSGQLSPIRLWLRDQMVLPFSQQMISVQSAMGVALLGAVIVLVIGCRQKNQTFSFWAKALMMGFLISLGWWLSTQYIRMMEKEIATVFWEGTFLEKPESLSYLYPMIKSLEWLRTAGSELVAYPYGLSLSLILGTIVGAALAYGVRQIKLTGFRDTKDLSTHMVGGLLMGSGGMIAGGCTVGQGLTGFSTGSLGAILTMIFIVLAAILTLLYRYR